uniref:beta-galactoside alpha-(2,6)-sialyltransferase n=1 Tax=Saccoglossus kowalevskii TaxID=10224 RepID=A0ABM0MPD4_SACKO
MKKRVFLLLIAITVCSLTAHLMFLWRSSIPQTPSRTTLAPARNIQNDSPQVKQGNPDLRKILHDYDKQFKEQPANAHEAVLRLNNAPTDRYEESVGRKTSIHLFNSKCFNKEAHINNTEAMFVNTTLVMWQTGPYNGNLYKWYQLKPVKLMLDKYIAWRKVFPSPDFYVIHPRSLWFAWDALEYFNKGNPIKKIVPSSGFT